MNFEREFLDSLLESEKNVRSLRPTWSAAEVIHLFDKPAKKLTVRVRGRYLDASPELDSVTGRLIHRRAAGTEHAGLYPIRHSDAGDLGEDHSIYEALPITESADFSSSFSSCMNQTLR